MSEKKNGICYIVGAGDFTGFDKSVFEKRIGCEDLILAADGGYDHLAGLGIKADILIGDFDSADSGYDVENIMRFSPEKDDTDMVIAAKFGLEQGYREFRLYGGTGGRLSHTVANIQLLAFLSKNGARGYLYDKNTEIISVTDGEINFDKTYSGYISVYAHGEKAEGVYIKGLKYPVHNGIFTNICPLGVSNEFIGTESSVSVKKGTLIIVIEQIQNWQRCSPYQKPDYFL